MAKSIRQVQAEAIAEGFIDQLAKDQKQYQELKQYPVLKKMIMLASEAFIDKAIEELNRLGKVNTGGLVDDISSTDVLENASGYEVELGYDAGSPSAKYYDYVNKGVKGVGKGGKSPYGFKTITPSKKMVSAIQLWMNQRGIKGRNEDMRYGLTADQRKNKSLSQLNRTKSLAYVVARSIKKKGIPYSGFFDKAVESQFGAGFNEAVGKAVAGDLRVYIRKLDSLINKEQNNNN